MILYTLLTPLFQRLSWKMPTSNLMDWKAKTLNIPTNETAYVRQSDENVICLKKSSAKLLFDERF